jgi:hypothetical protein
MQGGNRIQGPSTAPAGGNIEVTLTRGDAGVSVSNGGQNSLTNYKVGPNGKVTVSVPNTPGEFLFVTVEHGGNFTTIYIPITSTSP